MITDGKPIVHHFPDRQAIEIWPVFDLHIGEPDHAAEKWVTFYKSLLARDNAYVVLGGDLMTNGVRNSPGVGVYESTLRPREQKRLLVEMLKPLAAEGRILCGTEGNHEFRSAKDCDVFLMDDIMTMLGLSDLYRENIANIKLQFGNPHNNGQANPTYMMTVTHGSACGSTGAVLNKAEKFGSPMNCDILVVGHSHKPAMSALGRYHVDTRNNCSSVKPWLVVSATSWLEYAGYAMQRMMTPTCIAPQVIRLYGNKKEAEAVMKVAF